MWGDCIIELTYRIKLADGLGMFGFNNDMVIFHGFVLVVGGGGRLVRFYYSLIYLVGGIYLRKPLLVEKS